MRDSLKAHINISGDFLVQDIREMIGERTTIDIHCEKGVIVEKGRFAGELSKTSMINVYAPQKMNQRYHDQIEYLLKKAFRVLHHSTKLQLWVLYEYEHQCNLEFTPQQLKKLGELNIPLLISCWQKKPSIRI